MSACDRRPFDLRLPDVLTVTADGPVRTVTINRPAELNAVNKPLHWALANVWRQLAADTAAKVVVVTGAGRAFSAGGDLDWISCFLDDPVAREESLREGAQIIEEMLRFPLPVIAAVNGPAMGLGASVAVLSDVVLMSRTACPLSATVRRFAVATALDSLGLAEATLDATVDHVRTHEQFGRAVGSFQAVKHACADMLVSLRIAGRLVGAAVSAEVRDEPDAWIAAARAKSYTCAAAVDIAGKAIQLHGGMGYTWESGIHRYVERATLNRTLYGSPARNRAELAARYRDPAFLP